jgi:hypothetical protein
LLGVAPDFDEFVERRHELAIGFVLNHVVRRCAPRV